MGFLDKAGRERRVFFEVLGGQLKDAEAFACRGIYFRRLFHLGAADPWCSQWPKDAQRIGLTFLQTNHHNVPRNKGIATSSKGHQGRN